MKLPHWLQLALAFLLVSLTWLTSQSAAGAIALPTWYPAVASLLTVVLAGLGITSPSASPAANARAAKLAGLVSAVLLVWLVGAGVSACAGAAGAVPPAIDCGARIVDDALQGDTLAQIEADVGAPCGADVEAIIAALLGSQSPQVHATEAYGEALARSTTRDGGAAK